MLTAKDTYNILVWIYNILEWIMGAINRKEALTDIRIEGAFKMLDTVLILMIIGFKWKSFCWWNKEFYKSKERIGSWGLLVFDLWTAGR